MCYIDSILNHVNGKNDEIKPICRKIWFYLGCVPTRLFIGVFTIYAGLTYDSSVNIYLALLFGFVYTIASGFIVRAYIWSTTRVWWSYPIHSILFITAGALYFLSVPIEQLPFYVPGIIVLIDVLYGFIYSFIARNAFNPVNYNSLHTNSTV